MATRNGSPELVLRTIGGRMKKGIESINIIIDRVVKVIEFDEYEPRTIISLKTHDGNIVMLSGDNMKFTSQTLS